MSTTTHNGEEVNEFYNLRDVIKRNTKPTKIVIIIGNWNPTVEEGNELDLNGEIQTGYT